MYVYGDPLPRSRVAWFKKLGFKGVRSLLVDAERELAKQFPEFASFPEGTASTHLV